MSEKIKRALGNKEASVFIILIAVMLIATIFNPAFLTFSNIMDVMKGNATLGICSFGMLLIILTGGIDASGRSLFDEVRASSRAVLDGLLG